MYGVAQEETEGGVLTGTITLLRLAMESEAVAASIDRIVMRKVRSDMEEEVRNVS